MLDVLSRFKVYKELNPCELTPQQFRKLEKEIHNPNSYTKSDEYADFELWMNGLPSRQERFGQYICKRLANHPNAKILEVGCGRTGRLSRILNEAGFLMTGIDPRLEISNTNGIQFLKQEFNFKKVILSSYDYVIAQEPCDATEHIVRACISQNIPFIISLCGVPHKLINGATPKTANEWYNYLLSIAPDKLKLRYVALDPLFESPILKSKDF